VKKKNERGAKLVLGKPEGQTDFHSFPDEKTITIGASTSEAFVFDQVFDTNTAQVAIFDTCALPLLKQ
jgi:hypothetical protein